MADAKREWAVAVNLGSEPKLRAAFEAARNALPAKTVAAIYDSKRKLVARWNSKSGWVMYPKKPKAGGPALFISPFRLRLKVDEIFEFEREGNEAFMAPFQRPKKKR